MPRLTSDPPPAVADVFDSYPKDITRRLMELRRLILETAAEVPGAGPITEALKWGKPAFLTSDTGSGSTIRIAPTRPESAHDYAMYFICSTNLVEQFELRFGDVFSYERNRALLFTVGEPLPIPELRECVALALTYHLTRVPG